MMWKIVMTNKITELKEWRRRYTIPRRENTHLVESLMVVLYMQPM